MKKEIDYPSESTSYKSSDLHQMQSISLINQLILQTVSFLNDFARTCEEKFIDFEYKIQKVEASLVILESKIKSVPEVNNVDLPNIETIVEITENNDKKNTVEEPQKESVSEEKTIICNGTKAKDHQKYSKFFKMLQVGVPEQAVQLKMSLEGLDPNILRTPDKILNE